MKRLQNKACYEMVFNDKYLCAVGRTINVYDVSTQAHICNFVDMKHYSSAQFAAENILVAKNTSGVFKVYDLEKAQCVQTIKIAKIKASQDTRFSLSADNKFIYDVLDMETRSGDQFIYDKRLYKINIETGEYDCVKLGEGIWVVQNISLDEQNNNVLIINGSMGNITVTQVNLRSMTCRKIFEKLKSPNERNKSLTFYDNRYLLFENMEIIDITNSQTVRKVGFDCLGYGYVSRVYFSNDKKYLYLIYSDRIIIFDFQENKILKEYSFKYCSCAEVIGDNVYIGTWEMLLYENCIELLQE